MKVTTTPRYCYKVNKIVPIMQEHLGPVMNLVLIKLLAFVLHALCVVQTVSLHKIASAMPTSVERDSNLRPSVSIPSSLTESLSARNGASISTTDASDTTCESSRIFSCVIPNPLKMSGHGICFTASSSDKSVSTTSCFSSKVIMSTLPEPC